MAALREVGEAQGDQGLLQARGAICTLLGWTTLEWATGQEARHQKERDALRADTREAQRQLRELQGCWQEKRANLQRSEAVAAMNYRLLKEVEAGADEITRLKAAERAAADQCRREKEEADRKEEQASQLGNALKAAEKARAAEQEAWVAKEADWGRERDNLLEAYEKGRQGLERAVHKLREEKEKQAANEEESRSIRMKRRMRSRRPPPSESGGEQTRGPTPG